MKAADFSTDGIHVVCSFLLVFRSLKHLRELVACELARAPPSPLAAASAPSSRGGGGAHSPPRTPPRRASGVPPTVHEYLASSPLRRASLGSPGRHAPPPPPDPAAHSRRGFFLLRVWALLGLAHCAASVGVLYARELRALLALLGALPLDVAESCVEPLWAGAAVPLLGSALPTLLRDAQAGAVWAASVALPAAARAAERLSAVALPLLLPLLSVPELRALVARLDSAIAALPLGDPASARRGGAVPSPT